MKSNQLKVVVLGGFVFLAYLTSYLICRSIYATREDEFITYYNQSSLIGQVSYLIHAPLWELDSAMTGRYTKIGKWRDMSEEIAMRETIAFAWFATSAALGAVVLLNGLRRFRRGRLHRIET
jgi:hypothetical protein